MAMKKGKKMAKPAKKSGSKKPAMKAAPKAQSSTKVDKAKSVTAPRNSSTKSFTYSEFIENIRGFCGLPKRSHAKEMCEDIARFVRESLRKGYKIPLLGLGKIYVRESKARMGRNPATGEMIQIPARKRVRFTAAKALKDAVLR